MEVKNIEQGSLEGRSKILYDEFHRAYGSSPTVIIRVPGRVNIIGEHIDYCGYAVHPMAIDQDMLVAVKTTDDNGLSLKNLDPKYEDYHLDSLENIQIPNNKPSWWGYFLCGLKGVQEECQVSGSKGVQVLVSGVIPPSAGLSSSSALVVSAALVSVWSQAISIEKETLANICARSERFIGTQGGGMDQAIEILAEKGSAKLIEFNPLKTYNVKLPKGATFVVANTLEEKNKAASNDFNTRVVECRISAKILAKSLLGGETWRDLMKLKDVQTSVGVSISDMVENVEKILHEEEYSDEEVIKVLGIDRDYLQQQILTPNTQNVTRFKLHQRAKHVYSEADRVYRFRDTCVSNNSDSLSQCGQLMSESHTSCSQLYQCSSPGLDTLTSLAAQFGALGARLTGAGWGGCMVALVKEEEADTFIKKIKEAYYKPLNLDQVTLETAIFVTKPGEGASILNIS